jgi:hypothetical protein
MKTITEAELVDNAKNGAVVCIKAVPSQTKGKGFNLFVNLKWKEGDYLLITQQKEPRTWVSIDRLLSHIQEKYREVATLTIFLRGNENDQASP